MEQNLKWIMSFQYHGLFEVQSNNRIRIRSHFLVSNGAMMFRKISTNIYRITLLFLKFMFGENNRIFGLNIYIILYIF